MKQQLPVIKLRTAKITTADRLDTDAEPKNVVNPYRLTLNTC